MPLKDGILEPFGVTGEEERVYRYLLRAPGSPAAEVGRQLEISARKAAHLLRSLQQKALISRTSGPQAGFVALDPTVVVEGLFARRRDELEEALAVGKQLAEEAQSDPKPTGLSELVTIIEGEKAHQRQCDLLEASATAEVLGFYKAPEREFVDALDQNDGELLALSKGVSFRVVYDAAALQLPGHLPILDRYVAAGEKARVVPELPLRMMVFDRRVAIVPVDAEHPQQRGAVVLRSPWLLSAFTALFEAVWTAALPIAQVNEEESSASASSPEHLSATDRHILTLLLSGAKDAVIAQQMDVDITTVRRRIKRMMTLLGVATRFQAGAQAARRGWI